MMRNRFTILLMIIFVCLTGYVSAGEYTPYYIYGGLSGGLNMYSSKFKELPGVPNCCTEFTSGSGLNFGVYAGIASDIKKKFSIFSSYADIMIGYENLSGNFAEQAEFGNVIIGNEHFKGISEHSIDAGLGVIFLEPGFSVKSREFLPLSFRLGLKGGLLLSKSYTQKETIITPENVNFETGTRVRGESSGTIINANPLLFFLTFSLKYDLINKNGLYLSPFIKYEYGFSNAVTSLNWKINSLTAGVELALNLPKQKTELPAPSPIPNLPEPPKANELALELTLKTRGMKLNNFDTINFSISKRSFVKSYPVVPVLFFEKNSSSLIAEKSVNSDGIDDQQKNLNLILSHLKTNPDKLNKIEILSTDDEDENVSANRKKYIYNLLISQGLNVMDFVFEEIIQPVRKLKHPELADENRAVKFEVGLLNNLVETGKQVKAESVDIEINPLARSNALPLKVSGVINHHGNKIFNFGAEPIVYSIQDNNSNSVFSNEGNPLNFIVNANDAEGNRKSDSLTIILKPKILSDIVFDNVTETINDSSFTQQFVLGYFDFDNDEFNYINTKASETVKEAFGKGSKIEIYPLTDNLGDENHNSGLAKRRALSALKILGLKKEEVKIVYPENYLFDNNVILGRVANRSVIVKIITR